MDMGKRFKGREIGAYNRRPRILDLYCGGGGMSMGFYQVGFDVVGVDMHRQPLYPFSFLRADVLDLDPDVIASRFDAVHASPPCQAYSTTKSVTRHIDHPDLVEPTRELLEETGLPYVIENVPGAPLHNPVMLCGSSFGLRVRRHRLFESTFDIPELRCDHAWQDRDPIYKIRQSGGRSRWSGMMPVYGHNQLVVGDLMPGQREMDMAREAMGIWWMSRGALTQAIPPAYARHVGRALLRELL